jgi:hypothetical protein
MPSVRKLSLEEVFSLENKSNGRRKLTQARYDQALADFDCGDFGELIPDTDEKRLTARNRLKAAASRRGFSLTFLPTRGEAMRFKVNAGDTYVDVAPIAEPEPEPVSVSSEALPKRRGGRPRKSSAV